MSGFCLQFLPLRGFSWSAPTAGFLDPPLEPRLLVQLQLGSSELHWKMSKLPIAQAKITSINKCFGWELSLHVSVLISLLETSLSNKFVRSDRSSLCHYWPSTLLAVQATSHVMLLMVIQEWGRPLVEAVWENVWPTYPLTGSGGGSTGRFLWSLLPRPRCTSASNSPLLNYFSENHFCSALIFGSHQSSSSSAVFVFNSNSSFE